MSREFDPIVKQITQEMINRYAVASGDYNPIHVDEEYAKTTQFGGTIAHAMMVLAYVNELASREFGEEWLRTGKLKARFKSPARHGDTITVSATEHDNGLRVECANQRGDKVLIATASLK